jgi:hypothetical protein
MQQRSLSPGSGHRNLSALLSLFDYLCERNVIGQPGRRREATVRIETDDLSLTKGVPSLKIQRFSLFLTAFVRVFSGVIGEKVVGRSRFDHVSTADLRSSIAWCPYTVRIT